MQDFLFIYIIDTILIVNQSLDYDIWTVWLYSTQFINMIFFLFQSNLLAAWKQSDSQGEHRICGETRHHASDRW